MIVRYNGKLVLVRDDRIIATGKDRHELRSNYQAHKIIQKLKQQGKWLT